MMCLWVSFKGEKNHKKFFASLNLWRKDPDPEPDPLVRGTDPGIRIRIKLSRITNTGIILKWRWSGLVSLWGSSEALLRIRKEEMRIRIPLFTLTRIRIHFSLWCSSGSYSYQSKTNLQPLGGFRPSRLHFEPPGLHYERPRPSKASFWASTAPEFLLCSDPDPTFHLSPWYGSGSSIPKWCESMWIWIRIRDIIGNFESL